jgi:hypothetical protein
MFGSSSDHRQEVLYKKKSFTYARLIIKGGNLNTACVNGRTAVLIQHCVRKVYGDWRHSSICYTSQHHREVPSSYSMFIETSLPSVEREGLPDQ